jgi:UDP-glucose:(heptosyl)LPS alpha-1,3-glucosyltransferase
MTKPPDLIPMKIALIHKRVSSYGGAERYISNLSKKLASSGEEVHIYAHQWETVSGVRFHKVPMLKLGRAARMLSFAYATRKIGTRNEYDIVQGFGKTIRQDIFRAGGGVHKAWMKESLDAVRNPLWRKIKSIVRAFLPVQWLTLYIERQTFKQENYRRIIAVSEKVKKQLMEYYGVPHEAITVIHNGVDTSLFNLSDAERNRSRVRAGFGISENDLMMIFASTNFQLKGLEYLLRGMAGLNREDIKLMVVGGDTAGPYRKIAVSLGLGARLIFAGRCTNMKEIYQAGDLFVYPTLYDPFANVCLEAMACGLPVITSRVNGVSDIIEEGISGLIINDPTDPSEISEKISMMLDREKRRLMAENAYRKALACDMDGHHERVMKLYEEVMVQKRGHAA